MSRTRHPRTMQEAFGPYVNNTLHPIDDRIGRLRWSALCAGGVALAGVVILVAWAVWQ